MSQYYPQQGPGYPPPPPPQLPQPPQQNPEGYYEEGDYEYEEVDEAGFSTTHMALAFFSGGCLVFICVSICAFMLAVLWYIDPGAEGGASSSIPGSDIGLSFTDPAYPNESVVNDQGVQLTILDVNRNASVETIPAVEGRETIIVTVELVNMGDLDAEFSERDFILLNVYEEAYAATPGAIAGSLGRGILPPNEGLEGRLVYELTAGELDLQLLWESMESSPRFILLQ